MSLDLIVDENYHLKELEDKGLYLLRFYSQNTIFADDDGNGYLFKNDPLKRLKIRFRYAQSIKLPQMDVYTTYDNEEIEEELLNCCSPARLGLDLD